MSKTIVNITVKPGTRIRRFDELEVGTFFRTVVCSKTLCQKVVEGDDDSFCPINAVRLMLPWGILSPTKPDVQCIVVRKIDITTSD